MTDKVGPCDAVRFEIMAYEKFNGHRPAFLILQSKKFQDAFFSDIYEFTMKTTDADFKEPGKFMGVTLLWDKIWSYGGSCDFLLVGGFK